MNIKSRKVISTILASTLLFGALTACDQDNSNSDNSPEISNKELIDKLKVKEQAKQDILSNPSAYIQTGEWTKYDKGIVNYYTKATAINFTNSTDFYISSISGQITFLDESGQELGTVPFKTSGELAPQQSANLEVESGEVSGNGNRANISIQSVRVSE